ncbi:MAG: prohibitin family protein [Leptospirales bacterium]|nr:prohibitin family protein [Leptospirales bacterium]
MKELFLNNKKLILVGGGIFLLLVFVNPCVLIPAGHRGVVMNFGAVSNRIMPEGLNFRTPVVQTVIKVNVQIQKHEVTASAASKDLQEIQSTIALNFHVNPDEVDKIYQQIGEDYMERIIDPGVQESVKAVTAKYTAVELITNRHVVTEEIETALRERLKPYHITVDQVNTKDFDFSEKFKAAIEAKQEAEQLALKAQRDLDRIRTEAEQQVTTARAEGEAYRLKTQSLSPLLRDMEWIKKWNGHLPQVQGSGVPLIQIPLQNQ